MWQSDAKRAKSNEQNDSFLPPIYDYSANRPRSQEFRCSFTNKVFVFHPLPSIDPNAPWRQKELLPDKEVLERSALVRSQFWVWYDSETNCRREIATILRRNNYDDAVLWFWAEKRFPYDDERKPINKNPIIQAVVQECLELLARADRLGFINFYKDTFMINQRRWKNKIEGIMTTPLIRPSTALKVSNSVQVEIRRFIDDRKGLFFDNSWLPEDGSTVTTEQVRFKTIAALRSFSENIEKRLLPLLPTAKSKVRSVNIGLVHELTKAAYSTVLEYLRTLHNSKSIIGIKCTPKETSLFLPSEKAFEDLVAPIVEVCKHAMVKVSPEEHASWIGNCRRLIDSLLDLNSLSARPPLPAFASLIANEKVAEGASERAMVTEILSARQHQLLLQRSKKTLVVGLFCIDMTNVWEEMKIRAAALIADYAFRLKLAYDKDVGALMEEFRSYDRMVSFRSLDTPAMLASKAEIDLLRSQTIPRAVERLLIMYERLYALTDVITFDKSDHERLLAVAALRKKLPRLLSEYQLYFDRRLNAYTAYIKQRQSEVAKQAADAVERLKILLSFANPAETADYVAKLLELRPLLLTVGADVDELNSYEAVVGLPRTELPKISQFALTVESMMRLFTATVDFHNHSDDFFARKRTEADVSGSEAFIIHYLAELAELETELGTNRAARHFILQARNEVDRFRRNFSVARVMSCPRFRERHWTRMSEIVGFDLSGYVQATVSQICELDLDSFVSKLIPIAASAEKEASVEDQVNSIAAAWQEIFFTMDVSTFWDIALPTNLDSLMATLANDLSTLRVSRNVGDANGHPAVIDKLIKWLGDLTSLNERLRSWSTSLRLWQRLADIVTNAKGALATEFSEFRSVAKYWRRFAELIDDNQSVIAMLTWTHADCWLRIINEHLNKIVQGLTDHWLMMKKTSARLTFLSDFDLLRLMSGIPLEESLETLRQHCFRHLAKFIVVDDAIASIENVPGEKMTFEEPLSLLSLVQCRPLDFVIAFENAIDEHFCQEYAAVIADRAKKTGKMYLMGSPLIQLMDRLVMQGSTKSVSQFRYVWQNRTFVLISRGGRRQTKLKLDFVASKAADFVSSEFANRWSKGKCPLLIGDSETNRHFAANISQLMFTSIHFLNCHWRLKTTTIESIVHAATDGSIVVVLENADQLGDNGTAALLTAIAKLEESILPNKLTSSHYLFIHDIRDLSVTKRAHSTSSQLESLVGGLQPTEMSIDDFEGRSLAFLGPGAKSALHQALTGCRVAWLYLDAFESSQLLTNSNEFGAEATGYLMSELVGLSNDAANHFIVFHVVRTFETHFPILVSLFADEPYLTFPDGTNFYLPTNVRFILCLPAMATATVRLSAHSIEAVHFPDYQGKSTSVIWREYMPKLFTVCKSERIYAVAVETMEAVILPLLPNDAKMLPILELLASDLSDIAPSSVYKSDFDIVRWTVLSVFVNWLALLNTSDIESFNRRVIELVHESELFADATQVPTDIANWKLSSLELGKWVKWLDEPYSSSFLPRHVHAKDLIVVYPEMDRVLHYAAKLLQLSSSIIHLIITGPRLCGKTALAERLAHQLEAEGRNIIWFPSVERFVLSQVQSCLMDLLSSDQKAVIIFDEFQASEASVALLEMFAESKLVVHNGSPFRLETTAQIVLVMNDSEYSNLQSNGTLTDEFLRIPLPTADDNSLQAIFQKLFTWHLHVKAFSSDYHQMVESMGLATLRVVSELIENPLMHLPTLVTAVKGLMFSSPEMTPDIDSMLRLWAHEILRVVGDAQQSRGRSLQLFETIKLALETDCDASLLTLFRHLDFDQSGTVDESEIGHLLFCDFAVAGSGQAEGLAYVNIKDRAKFERTVANFLGEYNESSPTRKLNLAPTSLIVEKCAQLGRVLRQASSHIALVGSPGSGRRSCLKLAAYATNTVVLSAPISFGTNSDFERSWTNCVRRALRFVSSANQHIVCLFDMHEMKSFTPPWLEMLKQYLRRPDPLKLISKEELLAMAEAMGDCEKILATIMQGGNIRLPGQRHCDFPSEDSLKDVNVLQKLLADRFIDQFHIAFLIDVSQASEFAWCPTHYFHEPTTEETDSMQSVLLTRANLGGNDLELVQHSLCDMFSLATSKTTFIELSSKLMFSLFATFADIYHNEKHRLTERLSSLTAACKALEKMVELSTVGGDRTMIELKGQLEMDENAALDVRRRLIGQTQLFERLEKTIAADEPALEELKVEFSTTKTEVASMVDAPRASFKSILEKLTAYKRADFKKLAVIKKPSLGTRYALECLRHLMEPEFAPKRNTLETWDGSRLALGKTSLAQKITSFDPETIGVEQIDKLQKYLEHRDYKPAKIVNESKLAADLCEWSYAVVELVKANASVIEQQQVCSMLESEIGLRDRQLRETKETFETVKMQVDALKEALLEIEEAIGRTKRVIDYRSRSQTILTSLNNYWIRWSAEQDSLRVNTDYLLGNALLTAACRTFLCQLRNDARLPIILTWIEAIRSRAILFDDQCVKPSVFLSQFIRQTNISTRWPLIIDVSQEVLSFCKESFADCEAAKASQSDLSSVVKRCARLGLPLVVADLVQDLPVTWNDLLAADVQKDDDALLVKFEAETILMHRNFRLLLVTRTELKRFSKAFLRSVSFVRADVPFEAATTTTTTGGAAVVGEQTATGSLVGVERQLLALLSQSNIGDILDSQEITDEIARLAGDRNISVAD